MVYLLHRKARGSPKRGSIKAAARDTHNRKPMLQDKRRSQRYAVSGFVQIQDTIGSPPRECRLTDISDGGVRLYADRLNVADDFVLWLPGGKPRRRCRVIWRLGPEIGAEFIDAPEQNFAHRVAGAYGR